MSNIIGDLLWFYFTRPRQAGQIDAMINYAREVRSKGLDVPEDYVDIEIKNFGITDPVLIESFRTRFTKLDPPSKNPSREANGLLETVTGQGAKAQLEAIAGITIDDNDVYSSRLFKQLGIVTNVGALAAAAEIAGAAIPTTNLQHAGIAVRSYMDISGVTQITGFGYGMMFSNVISPLLSYELNAKMRPTLPMSPDLLRMRQRGFLTDEQTEKALSKLGYSDVYQEAMKQAALFYPPAVDLVRFAVRDTFNESVVSRYGYDNDYPSAIDEKAALGGMPKEWMKHYWRAHWELPSPQMGFEMLHRGIIDLSDLQTLLRISDMAPFWIDKVVGISYSPYTRVDIRRMYADGILGADEVKKAYLDIGYDEEHAENLTKWTTKGIAGEKKQKVKDLTESAVMRSYQYGQKSTDETSAALTALGYDADEAALLIKLTDYKSYEDELAMEWKVIKAQYLADIIDDDGAAKRMSELQLTQKEQEKWLRQLGREYEYMLATIELARRKAAIKAESG